MDLYDYGLFIDRGNGLTEFNDEDHEGEEQGSTQDTETN